MRYSMHMVKRVQSRQNRVFQMCECCVMKQKRIRVLESDLQFETKRLREDQAQHLVTLEQNQQREIRRLQQKYSKERIEREEDNRKWMHKYDITVLQHAQSITQRQRQLQIKFNNEITKIQMQCQSATEMLKKAHLQEIQAINQRYERELNHISMQNKERVERLNKEWEKNSIIKINQLKENHNLKMQQFIVNYQLMEKNKKKQIQDLQQTLNILKEKQEKIYSEYCLRGNEIQKLKKQLFLTQMNLSDQNEKIKLKQMEIQTLKQQQLEQINRVTKQLQDKIQKIQKQLKDKIVEMMKKQLRDCEQYERTVKQMEQKRLIEADMQRTSLNEIKLHFENRPSKTKDTETIMQLKELLWHREREYESAVREAKEYRLELENKQETFNRMFVNSASGSSGSILKTQEKKNKLKRTSIKNALFNKQLYSFASTSTMAYVGQPSDNGKKEKSSYFTRTTKII